MNNAQIIETKSQKIRDLEKENNDLKKEVRYLKRQIERMKKRWTITKGSSFGSKQPSTQKPTLGQSPPSAGDSIALCRAGKVN